MLNRLRDEMEYPALRGVPFAGCLRAKVTSYADGITAFVFRQSDMKTVRKVIERYEEVAKINFDKILQLQFCSWVSGGVALPCLNLSAGVTDPSAFSSCGLGPTSKWNEIGRVYGPR